TRQDATRRLQKIRMRPFPSPLSIMLRMKNKERLIDRLAPVSYFVFIQRYKVALEISRVLQISSMVLALLPYSDRANATFFGVLRLCAFGLPPKRPLALAAR